MNDNYLLIIIASNHVVTQNMIATRPGIQRISGITVSDARGKKLYDTLPDVEVSCFN